MEKDGKEKEEYDIEYRVIDFWQCETLENKKFIIYYLKEII